jgi:UTP-glucose-1-phosphate uridylyltransferase
MGKKIDDAFSKLLSESRHHTKLSQVRGDPFECGFANGFVEAMRIVDQVRNKE